MRKETRHDGSFIAADVDGNEYLIDVYIEIVGAGSFENPNATIEGMRTLKTRDGDSVNYLDKGKYQLVQTGVILESSDPGAF